MAPTISPIRRAILATAVKDPKIKDPLYMFVTVKVYIDLCITSHGSGKPVDFCGLQKLDRHSQVWSSSK